MATKEKRTGAATIIRDEPARKAPVSTVSSAAVAAEPKPISTRPVATAPVSPAAALPFGRRNYTFMLAGIGVILLGFFIMSLDKEEFGFGFMGLTLGPIVVMSGFMLEFFAILSRPKRGQA